MAARDEIHWTPRLAPTKIRRLYESEAAGHLDDALLDDVGLTLLMRCQDILDVHAATRDGTVVCPRCKAAGTRTLIARPRLRYQDSRDAPFACPACNWSCTWGDYRRSFQRRQLNLGGAGPAFRTYVAAYPAARTPQQKMILIDQLIHAFHFSLASDPDRPTRAACVNLIQGRLSTVVPFLNALTAGQNLTGPLAETHRQWRAHLNAAGAWHPR